MTTPSAKAGSPLAAIIMVRRDTEAGRVAKAAFKRQFLQIKDDIASGRITFRGQPPEWTEKLLNITAFNCAILKIREEARWN